MPGSCCRGSNGLAERLADLGVAHGNLVVGGWSAGGHLAAMAAEDGRVRAGFALSGLFDLDPLRRTFVNENLRLDAAAAQRNSPLHRPFVPIPFDVAVGADELPEFRRQARTFAAARAAMGLPESFVLYPSHNHYTILDALGDPASDVVAGLARSIAR